MLSISILNENWFTPLFNVGGKIVRGLNMVNKPTQLAPISKATIPVSNGVQQIPGLPRVALPPVKPTPTPHVQWGATPEELRRMAAVGVGGAGVAGVTAAAVNAGNNNQQQPTPAGTNQQQQPAAPTTNTAGSANAEQPYDGGFDPLTAGLAIGGLGVGYKLFSSGQRR